MSTDARMAQDTSPQQVLDRVDEPVFALDEDWQFTFMNDRMVEIVDDNPDELLGSTLWDSFPAARDSNAETQFHAAMDERESKRFDMHFEPSDAWFSVRVYPSPDGLTVCFYDVTEERGRQLELQRKRRLFEAVFEDTNDALVIADSDRRITDFNPAAQRLFGYDPEEVVGEKSRFLYADETDYERKGETRFNEEAPEQHDPYRVTYERADGTTFEGETVGTPLQGRGGETLAFLGAIRDVSDQVAYERAIEERNDVLRQFHDVTTDETGTFDAVVSDVLELATDHLDLDIGVLTRTDGTECHVETALAPGGEFQTGDTFDLESTVGKRILEGNGAVGFHTPEADGATGHPASETIGFESYLGAQVVVDGGRYGAVHFASRTTRDRPISESEKAFVRLLAQWVGKEISRRQSRERARASSHRLRQIIDMLPQLVFAKDEDGTFLLANEALADAYGTTVSALEGATDADFADSEAELEQFGADDCAVIQAGEQKHIPEESLTTANGEECTFETTKIPYDPVETDGDAVLSVASDITDRKQLEKELRGRKQSIRSVTEIAADPDRSFEAKLEAILDLGCERLGLPYGFLNRIDEDTQHTIKATGSHPLITDSASAPLSETYCRKTIEGEGLLGVENAVEEGWSDDPAYERFDLGCYLGAKVFVDGDLYGTLCFAGEQSRDHEFDAPERTFVELLVQWIGYELDSQAVETKLRGLNESSRRLLATESADDIASVVLQTATSVLDMPVAGVWRYDDRSETLQPMTMTDGAETLLETQPTIDRGDGLIWDAFEAGDIAVYDDLRSVDGLINDETAVRSETIIPIAEYGVITAGSVEKRAFSDTDVNLLEVLSATVEAAWSRSKREQVLRETQDRLAESNEQLERFAYAASHDLQEPLRTVASYLTLLERRHRDDLDEDAEEFIDIAVDAVERMREMIQGLLAYSRVDTRGEAFEPVSLDGVFDRVEQNLEVTITESDADVTFAEVNGTVSGDREQLVQLFQNLVDNAITYSDGPPTVDVSVSHHDDSLTVAVADDGIGMNSEQVGEIFDVFQRLHTREEFDGTGIGLSLCQKIVDRHDGDIRVESDPGDGSTFHVTLPTAEDRVTPPTAEDRVTPPTAEDTDE